MSIAPESLDIFQWAIEGTKGSLQASTSKIVCDTMDLEPMDAFYRPKIANGLVQRSSGPETVTMRGTNWTITGDITYEQAQNLINAAVASGLTGGAGPLYVYTATRNPAVAPTNIGLTLQRRITDGTNSIDNKVAYAMPTSLKISCALNGTWRYEMKGFGRRIQTAAITAAQALPVLDAGSIPPLSLTKLYIDSTWGTLGSTQVSAQMLSFSVEFLTGYRPQMAADARSDQDFSVDVFNADDVGMNVDIQLLVNANAGQYATEKTAAEAGTLRAVRIQCDGSTSRQIQLDMLLKHTAASVFTVPVNDGQHIVNLKLQESSDLTNLFRAKVSNAIATII